MWLVSPNLHTKHGFSTRDGGYSQGVFAGWNFDARQDNPKHVAQNQQQALQLLGLHDAKVATLEQVHGTDVVIAREGVQTADAHVTRESHLTLTILTADCFPVLLFDPISRVIGAAHAGWRGTVGNIVQKTIHAMQHLGAIPEQVVAAIGVGICQQHYPVHQDVAQQFQAVGLGACVDHNHVNLSQANVLLLQQAGVKNIHCLGRCSTEADFYSYRRDHGSTGRMWAVISL